MPVVGGGGGPIVVVEGYLSRECKVKGYSNAFKDVQFSTAICQV